MQKCCSKPSLSAENPVNAFICGWIITLFVFAIICILTCYSNWLRAPARESILHFKHNLLSLSVIFWQAICEFKGQYHNPFVWPYIQVSNLTGFQLKITNSCNEIELHTFLDNKLPCLFKRWQFMNCMHTALPLSCTAFTFAMIFHLFAQMVLLFRFL